jgi:prevent-host-death family protein
VTDKIRLDEDIYGVTDLRESLQQVIDKAVKTKRPMVITKRGRPVAAIVGIRELQRLYDAIGRPARSEDAELRGLVEAFEAAEESGGIEWLSDAEMQKWLDGLVGGAEKRA